MALPRHCLGCHRVIPRGSRCKRCDTSQRVHSSYAWQQVRAQVRAAAPWCVDCGATDDLTVDHVVPLSEGGTRLDPANLVVRCRRHNSARRSEGSDPTMLGHGDGPATA